MYRPQVLSGTLKITYFIMNSCLRIARVHKFTSLKRQALSSVFPVYPRCILILRNPYVAYCVAAVARVVVAELHSYNHCYHNKIYWSKRLRRRVLRVKHFKPAVHNLHVNLLCDVIIGIWGDGRYRYRHLNNAK